MHYQRFLLAVVLLALGIMIVGCGSAQPTAQARQSCFLQPCAWVQDGDPKIASMAALIQTFQSNRWRITQGSAEYGFIRAEASRRRLIISVDAYIDSGGAIEIYESPNQSLDQSGSEVLESWFNNLRRRFRQYQCELPPDHVALVESLYMSSATIPPKPVEVAK